MSPTQHHLERAIDPRLGAAPIISSGSTISASSHIRPPSSGSALLPSLHPSYSDRTRAHPHQLTSHSRPYDNQPPDTSNGYNPDSPQQQSPRSYYQYSPLVQHATASQLSRDSNSASNGQPSPSGGQYGPGGQDASPEAVGDGGLADDPKRPRACEGCRGLKVRCDQDPAHPEIPCKRCAKAGRQCIITQPSRKRQKKSDNRVAELERKLDALTQALQQQGQPRADSIALPPSYPPFNAPLPASDQSHGRGQISTLPPMQHYGQNVRVEESRPSVTPSLMNEASVPAKRRPTEDISEMSSIDHIRDHRQANSSEADSYSQRSEEPVNVELTRASEQLYPEPGVKPFNSARSGEEFIGRINRIVAPDTGTAIFDRYVTKLAPNLPAVVFPPDTTAEKVRREKPILYVCILSAACGRAVSPQASVQLAGEAVGALADCVVRNGAKSLELIQAMQVLAIWYKPPEKVEQTNFYQIIHMSAVMALDIGLGKRYNPAKARRGFGGPRANLAPGTGMAVPQDSDTLEARRAWLVCYYLCATASNVLRRPNLFRWTNYMQECILVLESHPDAYPSDKLLCQFVKIQHICEDIGRTFLMDDSSANISITDPKVTYALNVLESQLKSWKEDIPPECRDSTLQFFENCTSLYLHEIALHFNHNVEDFRMPFTEESLKSVNNTSDTLTQHQISALAACLKAAHGMLDTILSYHASFVSNLPMLMFFIRCTYALVVLVKMHVAITSPGSELGKMLRAEDLRVEYYMDRLVTLFEYVAFDLDAGPKPKALQILCTLRDWFKKHKEKTALVRPSVNQTKRAKLMNDTPLLTQQAQTLEQNQNASPSLHLLSQVAAGNQAQDQRQQDQHQNHHQQQQQQISPIHQASSMAQAKGQQGTAGTAGANADGAYSSWTYTDPIPVPCNRVNKYLRSPGYPITETSGAVSNAPPSSVDHLFPQPPEPSNGNNNHNAHGIHAANTAAANDFGWGTGFEQAMDLAMGGMDGLAGGELDGWFLGGNIAPFTLGTDLGHSQHHGHAALGVDNPSVGGVVGGPGPGTGRHPHW